MGGQAFIPETLERLLRIRELAASQPHDPVVEVDGGVNTDTIEDVYRAGANILVAGSAVFDADSPAERYRSCRDVAAAGEPAWA